MSTDHESFNTHTSYNSVDTNLGSEDSRKSSKYNVELEDPIRLAGIYILYLSH